MASNIDTTIELNKLIAQQNQLYAEQAKIIKGQIAMIRQMAEMLKQINPKANVGGWEDLSSAVEEAGKSVHSMGGSSQEILGTMNEVIEEGIEGFKGMGRTLAGVGKGLIALAGPAAIVKTLGNAITIVGSAATGVVNIMQSLGSAIVNVGVAIITAPFKMLHSLMNSATSGGSELRQALEDIRKQFGDLSTGSSKAIIDMSRGMKGQLAETGLSVYRIFGNLAERLREMTQYATQLGAMFNNLRDSLVANVEAVGAYVKGLGLTENGLKGVGRFALSTGTTFTEVGRQITSMAYGMGQAFGINGKEVSRAVGEMINDVKNFGSLSIKQLTSIAVFANKLGLEFQDLLGTIDRFDNFEQAAEAAAQLSQAFGLNVDALQLIQEQDPAARFEQLRKAFFQTGRSVEQMTRQELRLLSAQTGLSEEAVKLGFSLENQNVNYADVQKQAELTQKKQLTQAEAMQKLANSIERLVKSGSALQGGFFEIFFQGFLRGITMSREFRQMMLAIRQAMRITFQAGRQLGQIFVDLFPGVKDVFGGIRDMFNPASWRKMMQGVVEAFTKFFRDITVNPQAGLESLYKRLQEVFFNRFDSSAPAGRRVIEGFYKFFKTLFDVGVAAITLSLRFISNLISNAFTDGTAENNLVKGGISMLMRLRDAIIAFPWGETINNLKNNLLDWFLGATDSIDWGVVAENIRTYLRQSLSFAWRVISEAGPAIANAFSEIDFGTAAEIFVYGLGLALLAVMLNALPGLLISAGTTLIMDMLLPALLAGLELVGGAIFTLIGGWPTLIIAALAGIGIAILEWGDDLMNMMSEALDNIGPTIAGMIEEELPMVLDAMMAFIENLPDMIADAIAWIGEAISGAVNWLISSIKNLFSSGGTLSKSIAGFASTIGTALGNVFSGFLQKHFPNLWQGIVDTIGFFINLKTNVQNALTPILQWKTRYIEPVLKWINGFADSIRARFTSIVTSLPEPLQRFVGLVEGAWNRIMTAIEPVINRIREFISTIAQATGLSAFGGIAEQIGSVIPALGAAQETATKAGQITEEAVQASGDATEASLRQMEETTQRILGFQAAVMNAPIGEKPETGQAAASSAATIDTPTSFLKSMFEQIMGGPRGSSEAERRTQALRELSTINPPSPARVAQLERDIKAVTERYTKGIVGNIRDLVAAVNTVTADLNSIGDSPQRINVQLKQLANHLGVGGAQRLEIRNRNFTIALNVNVVLDADEFEQALISRPGSSRFVVRPGDENPGG
jgi:hypothetical protein